MAAGVTVVLVLGCGGLLVLDAEGVPQSEFVLGESEARDGQVVIDFPRGLTTGRDMQRHRFDFSFSGLKTAVSRWVEHQRADGVAISVPDVAASFQEAVVDVLTRKAVLACTEHDVAALQVGGGVAANSRLRAIAQQRCDDAGIQLRVPRPGLCTDNGAMVASLGAQMMLKGRPASDRSLPAGP